MLIAVYSFRNL